MTAGTLPARPPVRDDDDPDLDGLVKLYEWARSSVIAAHNADTRANGPVWNQDVWMALVDAADTSHELTADAGIDLGHCGTACCIAGMRALLDGWIPVRQAGSRWLLGWQDMAAEADGTYMQVGVVAWPSSTGDEPQVQEVDYAARRSLGLDADEAARLFEGNNDLYDIRDVILEIGERVGVDLAGRLPEPPDWYRYDRDDD